MRALTWIKERGAEFATVDASAAADAGGGWLCATGVAVGTDPLPYRLDYELDCGDGYVTSWLTVRAQGAGWQRRLELARDPDGRWSVQASAEGDPGVPLAPPGGDPAPFQQALDCDLGMCPVTNTMPVLRHGMLRGGEPREFVMAWVSVPDLSVRASTQKYTFVRHEVADAVGDAAVGDAAVGDAAVGDGPASVRAAGLSVIRYESGDFSADVVFDAEGFVVDYPFLGRRA